MTKKTSKKTTKTTKKSKESNTKAKATQELPKEDTAPNKKKLPKKLSSENRKSLDKVKVGILSKYGANSITTGKDLRDYGRISTGSLKLDVELGGGIPIGRATQISGLKSDGKTTLATKVLVKAQQKELRYDWIKREAVKGREVATTYNEVVKGLMTAIIDAEGHYDKEWAEQLGLDSDSYLYIKPKGAEEALDMALDLQKNGVHVIVIDSIEALVPTKEYETQLEDPLQMGIKPKILSRFLRTYSANNNALVRKGEPPCTLILINQLRDKIGAYGNPLFTPGGKSKDFYISIDLRLTKGDWIAEGTGDNKEIIGQVIKFKTEKNKTYFQQRSGEFEFYFKDSDSGDFLAGDIDNEKSIIMLALELGVIERSGAWFKFEGENLAQGSINTVKYLKYHDDIFAKVKTLVFKELGLEEA